MEKLRLKNWKKTINASPAELVIIGTPIDLRRIMKLEKPALRVRYDLEELGDKPLAKILAEL
jgi:predicted GTPase